MIELKNKILITANSYWNLYNFRKNLILNLLNKPYYIIAVAPEDKYLSKIQELGVKCISITLESSSTNPIKDISLYRQYKRILKNEKPNIILSFTIKPNIYASLAAKKQNLPILNNISGLGTVFIKQNLITILVKILYKKAFSGRNFVYFQNNDDKQVFLKNKLLNPSQAYLIPGSGIDTQYFSPKLPLVNKGIRFLFVGRLLKDKGIKEYFKAAKMVKSTYPKIQFLVIGEKTVDNKTAITVDMLNTFVSSKVIQYKEKVENIKPELENSDVVVLPSYREGMSRALLEAAAMAKPIITTDVPGCRDIVDDHENGYLCKTKNSADLVKKILQMINLSESERNKMGEKGRRKILKYYDEKFVFEKYNQLISNILSN